MEEWIEDIYVYRGDGMMVFREERKFAFLGVLGRRVWLGRVFGGVDMFVMRGMLKGVDRLMEFRWIVGRY